jgi:tetratricopeptide (TPR) repeat protein
VTDDSVVDALLAVSTIAEIEAVVREYGVPTPVLLRAVRRRRDEAAHVGRAAEADLLGFLAEQTDRLFPTAPNDTGKPSTFEQVLEAAAEAPSLLHAYVLLRRHAPLLPADPFAAAMGIVPSLRPDSRQASGRVLAVLGVFWGFPAQRLDARIIWGSLRRDAGDFVHALHHMSRAIEEAGPDGDPFRRGSARYLQGTLLEAQDDIEGAARAYQDALGIYQAAGEFAPHPRYSLAGCLRTLGMSQGALAQLEAAVDELTDTSFHTRESRLLIGRCLALRAMVHEDIGDYDLGAADSRAAAEVFAALGDRHREFSARTNLAASQAKRGLHADAIAEMRQIIRDVQHQGNPSRLAAAYNNLGATLLDADQPHAAASEYGNALAQIPPSAMTESASIALFGIGDCMARQPPAMDNAADRADVIEATYRMALLTGLAAGKELETLPLYLSRTGKGVADQETRAMLERAAAVARSKGDQRRGLFLGTLEADLLAKAGETGKALARYRALLDEALAGEASGDGIRGPDLTRLQVDYARLLREPGAPAQQALDVLLTALRVVDARLARALLDVRQAEIIAEAVSVYDELVALIVATSPGQLILPDDRSPAELAFDLHEEARARTFAASLAGARLPWPEGLPGALKEEEDRLLATERELQAHGPDQLDRLREVRERLAAVWSAMRPIAPEYVRLREGRALRLREVAPVLARADPATPVAVVSYYCTSDSTVCFLALPDGTSRAYHAGLGRDRLADVARRLRATFNGDPAAFPPTRPIARDAPHKRGLEFFHALAADLLPFTADVPEGMMLCLVPHGPLHLLPLHALPSAPAGSPLAARHPVVYAPSLSALAYILHRRPAGAAGPGAVSAFAGGTATQQDKYPDNFEHDDELFPANWTVRALRGTDASRGAVLDGVSGAQVVHLTCHGYFDERDPMRSGLLFSDGARRPPAGLGWLSRAQRTAFVVSARDLAETSLPARIVTLRACSAGIQGEVNRGDEFGGLVRSLLYSGAGSVVAALWNVDQRSSRDMLEIMYRRIAAGDPAWRALWLAQREFLERDDHPYLAHPYHWAPFVLVGDWR